MHLGHHICLKRRAGEQKREFSWSLGKAREIGSAIAGRGEWGDGKMRAKEMETEDGEGERRDGEMERQKGREIER